MHNGNISLPTVSGTSYVDEYMAKATLEWKDTDKFVFLWHGRLVLVHYYEGMYTVLTDLDPVTKSEVYQYLTGRKIKPPEESEEEDD